MFYGGGSAGERDFLRDAYQQGISAADLLDGSHLADIYVGQKDTASAGAKNVVSPSTVDDGADMAIVFGGSTGNPHHIGVVGLPTISGGYNNDVIQGIASTIAGGAHHIANAPGGHVAIGGGSTHEANGDYGHVGGGLQNKSEGYYSHIGGGGLNTSGDAANRAGKTHQTVAGGFSNEAKGHRATVGGGNNNTASGQESTVGGGKDNLVSTAATGGVVAGGDSNQVSAVYGGVPGGFGAVAELYGQQAHAAGVFAAGGDAQTSVLVARRSTTDATPAELFLDGIDDRLVLAADATWAFTITVVARRTDADGESAAYKFEGCIDNNAGTVALVGAVTKTVLAEDTAAWDCNVTADDVNNALVITGTAEAAKTVRWVARVELTQVAG